MRQKKSRHFCFSYEYIYKHSVRQSFLPRSTRRLPQNSQAKQIGEEVTEANNRAHIFWLKLPAFPSTTCGSITRVQSTPIKSTLNAWREIWVSTVWLLWKEGTWLSIIIMLMQKQVGLHFHLCLIVMTSFFTGISSSLSISLLAAWGELFENVASNVIRLDVWGFTSVYKHVIPFRLLVSSCRIWVIS